MHNKNILQKAIKEIEKKKKKCMTTFFSVLTTVKDTIVFYTMF